MNSSAARLGAAVALVAAFTCTMPSAALAATDPFEQQAVDCLLTSVVCELEGASIADPGAAGDALPGGVGVLVVPPERIEVFSGTQLAQSVRPAAGLAALIVVEDRQTDRFGVAADRGGEAILEALNGAGAADGGDAIVQAGPAIATALVGAGGAAGGTVNPPATESGGLAVGVLLVIAVGAVLTVGLLVALVLLIGGLLTPSQRQQRRRQRVEARLFNVGDQAETVRASLERLLELAQLYGSNLKYAVGGRPAGPEIAAVVGDVQELFRRIKSKGTAQQTRMAMIAYADTLKKLLIALEADYFKDIRDNPRLWENPEGRAREVWDAMAAVRGQVIENIRQVNASRDLEFQVALDSLVASAASPKLSDVYGSAPGGAPAPNQEKGSNNG